MATKVNINANVQSDNKTGINGEKSLKSLRTYQIGVVYKDKYGRETPVFTSDNGLFTIPKNSSDTKNSIVAYMRNPPPDWADSYKFFVKETSNEYYNVCMDRWYDAEDDNVWLSFPSSERNKIQEEEFIILKKPSDSDKAVHEESRYRVIDIQNEAPDFIKTDYEKYGEDTVTVSTGGAIPNSNTIKFDFEDSGSNDWNDSVFYDEILVDNFASPGTSTGFIGWPLENVVIDLSIPGARIGWLDVANVHLDGGKIYITLSKPFKGEQGDEDESGGILSVLPTGAGDVTVKIAKKVVKNKAEFDGKFFVKIRKDAIVEEHVRSVGNPLPSFNVVSTIQQYFIDKTQIANPTSTEFSTEKNYWTNMGEKWFIDKAERDGVGTGGGTGTKGPYPEDDGFGIIGDGSGKRTGSAKASLRCTMELSLNKVMDTNKAGFDISNNSQSNQDFLKKMSTKGTMFRWKEDPWQHIYKITAGTHNSLDGNTNGAGIYNYGSKNSQKKFMGNKTARLYLKFKTTGWRLDTPQGVTPVAPNTGVYLSATNEEGLYPFNYEKEYTAEGAGGQTYEWNPTMYGYGDYDDPTTTSPIDAGYGVAPVHNVYGTELGDGNSSAFTASDLDDKIYSNTIQIIETGTGDEEPTVPKNPAIWETEPREDIGLDIYYEASQAYPTNLNNKTNELFAPYGCVVTCSDVVVTGGTEKSLYLPGNTVLYDWAPTGHGGDTILLNIKTDEIGLWQPGFFLTQTPTFPNPVNPEYGNVATTFEYLNGLLVANNIILRFTRLDGSYTTAKVKYFSGWFQGTQPTPPTSPITYITQPNYFINGLTGYTGNSTDRVLIKLDRDLSGSKIKLPYFNCYSFGNGVESDRIRDDFNAVRLDKGVKVSTILDEPYEEEQRTNGLIYSGIYNSTSGVNNLNQFIAAEKITKDVNPSYGSIQKLKTRDTNLVAFCEDKVLKIMANKDALYSADLNPQLIASNAVLGNVTTFAGEFGISKNPESFAEEAFRMYFTDKQRGKVLRLSGDGITPISSYGMKDFFADNLKNFDNLIGSFDDRKGEYNLTMTKN
jgi:hypothetical protein